MKLYKLSGFPNDRVLVDEDGRMFKPFSIYVNSLQRQGYSANTIDAYGQHVARFINYISQAAAIYNGELNINAWRDIVGSYASYLLYGIDADNPISKQIAQENKKTRNTSFRSMVVIETAIVHYIEMGELEQFIEGEIYIHPMFPREFRKLSAFAFAQRKKKGFFGGLISQEHQSTVTSNINLFPYHKKRMTHVQRRFFPYEYIVELINCANCYRDKCLYALLAASGCRIHEALQLTLGDIDRDTLRVILVDSRDKRDGFVGLTAKEKSMLTWKGRATCSTFLIEPYRSLFFEHLGNYIRYERNGIVNHRYVFQNKNDHRPYFASNRQTRIRRFKRNVMKSGITDISGLSPHSLRHSYGRYVINYLPLPDGGFGLPLAWVKILMGHSSIRATEVYAKKDEVILDSILAHSNQTVFNHNSPSIESIRLNYLRDEISRLSDEIIILEGKVNG